LTIIIIIIIKKKRKEIWILLGHVSKELWCPRLRHQLLVSYTYCKIWKSIQGVPGSSEKYLTIIIIIIIINQKRNLDTFGTRIQGVLVSYMYNTDSFPFFEYSSFIDFNQALCLPSLFPLSLYV
jgi:hypothetical protein